jgi:methylase of polypeptide subunit release factors
MYCESITGGIYYFIKLIAKIAFTSRFLSNRLFNIKFLKGSPGLHYFDLVTFAMYQALMPLLIKGSRILDMGTGPYAVLGISFWKANGCTVTCADYNKEWVALAQENIQNNNAPIKVIWSNLFQNISRDFDFIIFNPPYIPAQIGKKWNLSEKDNSRWDGGSDGLKTIFRFLSEYSQAKNQAICCLGINSLFVSNEDIECLFSKFPKIIVEKKIRKKFFIVNIYIFKKLNKSN